MTIWQKLKKPIIALAPMAGITDSPFRQIARQFGADLVFSEMTSADGLYYNSEKTLDLLKFKKSEKPVIFQLFGKDPGHFPKAAKIIEKTGADGIDINFGCPARKVVAHGGGVTLMNDIDLAGKIIEATASATKLPVSIKIRAGYKNSISGLEFIKALKDLKIAGITVHGRTFEQGFSGPIDFAQIKAIKNLVNFPVLANGGINTPADAKAMLQKTGADGVALARGVLGNPWLFAAIKRGKEITPDLAKRKKVMLAHAKLASESKGKWGVIEMRKHLAWYIKGLPGARQLRAKLVRVETLRNIEKILERA